MLKFAANYCRFWVIDYYNISPPSPPPPSTLSPKRKLYLLCLTLPSHLLLCILSKLDFNTRSVVFEPLHVPLWCDYSFGFLHGLNILFALIVNNSSKVCQFVRRWHAANFPTVIHQVASKEHKVGGRHLDLYKVDTLICVKYKVDLYKFDFLLFIGNVPGQPNNSDSKNNS